MLVIFRRYGNKLQDICSTEDTHREKSASNKTPALRKSRNMRVRAVGTLYQLFIRGS